MRIVIYSGGQESSNHYIHQELVSLVTHGRSKSMTYIPYCTEGAQSFYRRAIKRYQRFGIRRFRYFAADVPFTAKERNAAFSSDIIYLAGGNTFYMLYHLRKAGLLPHLRKFVKRGGILAGLSAGAVLMTPHIGLAGYPKFDRDENQVNLKNLNALNLIRLEFFPHYRNSPVLDRALEKYSKKSKFPIYALPDGSGIVFEGKRRDFWGPGFVFYRGHKVKLV